MLESASAKRHMLTSFAWVVLAYLLALAAAFGVIQIMGDTRPVINTFIADLAGTLVIFVFGRIFRNDSFYDPYWSLAPIGIAFYWLFFVNIQTSISWNQFLVLTLLIIWGLRLTFNWANNWRGLKHEDWRYMEFRRTTGRLFWMIELVGIELVPTIVVFLGCLSLNPVFNSAQPAFGSFQILAVVVTVGAIIIETVADIQLKRFLIKNPPSGSIMHLGLWQYSRHPNYLGEILFWWGLWLFIPGNDAGRWLAVIGPLAITALFSFISIPLMEKHNLVRRLGYAEHTQKVSILLPWFPKK